MKDTIHLVSRGMIGVCLFASVAAAAELRLATPLSDHMVLQRDKPVRVWGWAASNAEVEVQFAGQSVSTKADADGRWKLILDPMTASSEPRRMVVRSGGEMNCIEDVLVGEVWMAAGQSNMNWRIATCRPADVALAMEDQFDHIRIMNVPKEHDLQPRKTTKAVWAPSTDKDQMGPFSGCAYFFAREIHQKLNVPIGVIDPSYGGTHIDSWIAPDAWSLEPSLAEGFDERKSREAGDKNGASRVFNACVAPLVGFTMRGFIWHQGEGNSQDGDAYRVKLRALIHGYRDLWGDEQLHFAIGQLYPFLAPYHESFDEIHRFCETSWAMVRASREIPYSGCILLSDLGQPYDIHPDEKRKMGHRYALWALATVYGDEDLVWSGPIARKATFADGGKHVLVLFDSIGSGLTTRDGGEPIWFRFELENGSYRPPHQKEIAADGSHVILELPANRNPPPVKVQMGWHTAAFPNLMNKEGLPASIFELPIEKHP